MLKVINGNALPTLLIWVKNDLFRCQKIWDGKFVEDDNLFIITWKSATVGALFVMLNNCLTVDVN